MQVKDTATKIPVIDLRPLLSDEPGAYQQTVDSFFHAYSSLGFATIINHGISQSIVKAAFDASRRFHSLPEQSKRLIELNHLHRGYIPINTSTDVTTKLATVKKPNQSESFMMMREDNEDSPDVQSGAFLAGANQWPELCGFKEAVSSCHDALSELGHKLMGIACGAMDANPADVMPAFECPTTWFRLLRYPPVPEDPDGDLFGSAPHTDFGCLTILLQDDTGGLQVMTPVGDWIDVQPLKNAFVVNVGDMLHRWSNGILKSTPHRVINRSGKERYSCPFFFDPHVNTVVTPLNSCITEQRPKQFTPINFGEFLKSELLAGYEHHKTAKDSR